MNYRKHGEGLFVPLVVVVLGLMTVVANAQAVTPLFTINGVKASHATFGATQLGASTLLVEKSNLALKCNTFELKEGLILSGLDAHAKFLYKECKAFEFTNPSGELPCHVSDVAAAKPELLHVSATALLLPVEFASKNYGILVENISAQVNFLSGTGCPLPLKNVIKGEVCLLIDAVSNDTEFPLLLSNPAMEGCPMVQLGGEGSPVRDELLFGANKAIIDSSVTLFLTEKHATLGVLLL